MARLLLILALVAVVFWVYSVVDCALQPATRHRGVSKGAWVVIVVLLPVVGGILWFAVGRGRRVVSKGSAPDDDADFLRTLGPGAAAGSAGERISPAEQEERIRRLEEELAQLDAEDEPRPGPADPRPGHAGPAAPRRPGDDDETRAS